MSSRRISKGCAGLVHGKPWRADRYSGAPLRAAERGWPAPELGRRGKVVFVELIVVAILVVFSFDFFNGFHDAANAIATVVATKVLTPTKAVGLAAVGNFVGMAFITNAIAETIGKGIIDPSVLGVGSVPSSDAQFLHTLAIIMGGVLGAIVWDLLTWYWGLPTSSSHALIGGMVGAALVKVGPEALLWSGIGKTVLFILLAPLIGLVIGLLMAIAVVWLFHRATPRRVDKVFRRG